MPDRTPHSRLAEAQRDYGVLPAEPAASLAARLAAANQALLVSRQTETRLREALERQLRRAYNPACACGHGPRDHRFHMDGGTGWCAAQYCKCPEWSPPPFDLAAEMDAALASAAAPEETR